MLSYIDPIIFPDRCDVLEIVPSQRYVYPIFKNGSSSLHASGFRTISHEELKSVETIDVFVRDPWQRFVSGVQTCVENLDYDRETTLHFIEHYLFLNRHYCPQFHWLLNLQRFTNARLRLLPLSQLNEIVSVHENKIVKDRAIEQRLSKNEKIQFYLQIDQALTENLLGQTVEFKQIVETIRQQYPDVYAEVIGRSMELIKHVLP